MKSFLLGMLVMYLITSELIVLSERFDWGGVDCSTDYPITWVLVFPQTAFYSLVNWLIYNKLRYYNVKSVIYDTYHKRWFYCDREDFELFKQTSQRAENEDELREELYNQFSEQFEKFYNDKLHSGFRVPHTLFNTRYVPKSVWVNLPKKSFGLSHKDWLCNEYDNIC